MTGSPLDTPISVTWFRDRFAATKSEESLSLRQIADRVLATTAASKLDLPLFKLARFGDRRTAKGSLRSNGNLEAITGLEADYDGEDMTPFEAEAALYAAGIAGLVYTCGVPDQSSAAADRTSRAGWPAEQRARRHAGRRELHGLASLLHGIRSREPGARRVGS
jgi:hypothetical protein